MASIKKLTSERSIIKAFFSRAANFVAATKTWDEEAIAELKGRFGRFDSNYEKFVDIQTTIQAALDPDDIHGQENSDKECEEFDRKFFRLSGKIQVIIETNADKHSKQSASVAYVISKQAMQDQISRIFEFFSSGYNNNLFELEGRLNQLESVWKRFIASETTSQADMAETENKYFEIYSLIKASLNTSNPNSAQIEANFNSDTRIKNVKLPAISLPQFNGNYSDWLAFRDIFQSLIHTTGLPNVQKLHYLKTSLIGDAANIIDSLEVTDDNYEIAWNLVTERFENMRLLIHNHVNGLFNLPNLTRESYSALRELMDAAKKHLRALKSLNQPVEFWDTLIIHIVVSRLDERTKREWEMTNLTTAPATLDELLAFLNNRCAHLETLYSGKVHESAKRTETTPRATPNSAFKKPFPQKQIKCNTLTNISCSYCKNNHIIFKCPSFQALAPAARGKEIAKLKLCTNCFRAGHEADSCQSSNCRVCQKKHNTMLHTDEKQESATTQPSSRSACSSSVHLNSTEVLLSTVLVKVFDKNGDALQVRALLDSGSQINFITADLSERLGLKVEKSEYSISGISQKAISVQNSAELTVHSRINNFQTKLSALLLPSISSYTPPVELSSVRMQIPEELILADPTFDEPIKIELLLGSEIFWNLLTEQPQIQLGVKLPTLIGSVFGWIISGSVPSRSKQIRCHLNTLERQIERFWSIEDISNTDIRSPEERACEEHFENTYARNSEGRFVLQLPFKEEMQRLGDSFSVANKRFKLLERKLNNNSELKENYCSFINEYFNLDHMELASSTSSNEEFFLPHHPVLREDSITTKLRVVFDASAKPYLGTSLNENLMVGPTIQPDLFSIVTRFRLHRYVLTSDITKMYRQILIADKDREFQKILWRVNPSEPIQIYRLKTVTYGTASAPFQAIKSLQKLAQEEESNFPKAKAVVDNDFYVDDLLTGASTKQELIEIREQVTKCLKRGGFELRKWASNTHQVLPHSNEIHDNNFINLDKQGHAKTLGLHWNFNSDTLAYQLGTVNQSRTITKRHVLSTIAKLFDPLGLVGPTVIIAKQLMQKLWTLKIDWDEPLPTQFQKLWLDFRDDLPNVNLLRIPRCVLSDISEKRVEIHGFCDASELAYGACIYIRVCNSQDCKSQLLCAKSKVSPLKTLAIPRLELCSAVLLATLLQKVLTALKLINFDPQVFLWTDSTIVLSWLSAPANTWKVFVAHRVAEILRVTKREHWSHVNCENNPADIISRGSSPTSLRDSDLWWSGPHFLQEVGAPWPTQPTLTDNALEKRQNVFTVQTTDTTDLNSYFYRVSSWSRLIRTIAYCRRFINNCKPKIPKFKLPYLTTAELKSASMSILKIVQQSEFKPELVNLNQNKEVSKTCRMRPLSPFLDPTGLIRVGGRLKRAEIPYDNKHQIILPQHNHVTDLIIKHEHERHLHAGNQATLAAVREIYWPISGKQQIRLATEIMGNLPKNRVTVSRPFLNSGVDYAGPFLIREAGGRNRRQVKVYIALFVCFCTKAVHIELVGELTSESFLGALKRFVSRRGNICNLYSDNGTNIVGARNELEEFFKSQEFLLKVPDALAMQNIQWHFIPARSPHFGGLWEAGVKSVKSHLKKLLTAASLTYEELYTLLVRIEGCLNSRPLSPLSDDPTDLKALTPGHFLIGAPLTAIPEPNLIDVKPARLSRWQRISQLYQDFWKRWYREYLPQLQNKTKWTQRSRNLCSPGKLVLIHEDHQPPQNWPLGRIVSTHPSDDGLIRVVSIQTARGLLKRCVQKICILPIEDNDDLSEAEEEATK